MTPRPNAAAALAALALVMGCSSEAAEEPTSLQPITASPVVPAASAGVLPADAQAPTPEGARAFARFWFEALNKAAATGDTADLRALAHPECQACRRFAESIDFLYKDGGGIRGGVFTVTAVEAPADSAAEEVPVTVVYDVTPTDQLNRDGSVRKRIEALRQVAGEMTVVRAGGSWQVRELVTT